MHSMFDNREDAVCWLWNWDHFKDLQEVNRDRQNTDQTAVVTFKSKLICKSGSLIRQMKIGNVDRGDWA